MKYRRIHILGASGAGTTTLGASLAERLEAPHFDTDDFFWEPTDPPFQRTRPREERQALLLGALEGREQWVLSGSLCGWGDAAIPFFDLVIYLWVPAEVRLARLRKREAVTFGLEAVSPGGLMHQHFTEFLDWAARYDEGGLDMRSRARHEQWLAGLGRPVVLRYEGEKALSDILEEVMDRLEL